jgi:hypothetical protein
MGPRSYAGRTHGSTNSKAAGKTGLSLFPQAMQVWGTCRVGASNRRTWFRQMPGATKEAYNFARSLSISSRMYTRRGLNHPRNPSCPWQFFSHCVKSVLVTNMDDAKKIRERATRLLNLATRSRCEDRPDFAAILTNLASEMLGHARNIEQRDERSPFDNSTGTSRPDAA